jgi:FdhD protein
MTNSPRDGDLPDCDTATADVPVKRIDRGAFVSGDDRVAVEEPLEISLQDASGDSQSIAITMRTPGADAELAVGFLLSEGIVRGVTDIISIENRAKENTVNVRLASHVQPDLDRLKRHFYATSSCGVCGKASIEALEVQPAFERPDEAFKISASDVCRLPAQMNSRQDVFAVTGGLHAAAKFDSSGNLIDICEDVGRHNALDKLAGRALLSDALPWHETGILVSGRASFELLQKAMMSGTPLLAAVGAPSSLAIDLAWQFGITLVGFLRQNRFNVYACPNRVIPD